MTVTGYQTTALQWGEINQALFHQHFFAIWQGTYSYIRGNQRGEIYCCNWFMCQGLADTGLCHHRTNAITGPYCSYLSKVTDVTSPMSHWTPCCHNSYVSKVLAVKLLLILQSKVLVFVDYPFHCCQKSCLLQLSLVIVLCYRKSLMSLLQDVALKLVLDYEPLLSLCLAATGQCSRLCVLFQVLSLWHVLSKINLQTWQLETGEKRRRTKNIYLYISL